MRFITGEGGWAGGQVRDVGLPRAAYAALCRVARSYSVEHTEVVHQPTLQKGAQLWRASIINTAQTPQFLPSLCTTHTNTAVKLGDEAGHTPTHYTRYTTFCSTGVMHWASFKQASVLVCLKIGHTQGKIIWRSETRKHCAPNFLPCCRPLPGGAGPPKFNQLEMVTTCTYRPSLVKIGARSFELSC